MPRLLTSQDQSSGRKRSRGQPTKFREEYVEQVRALCEAGVRDEEIAAFLGARHRRGIALVVVVDELDGTAQQPALCVDVLFPDLLGEERGLAVGRKAARHCHAEADLD